MAGRGVDRLGMARCGAVAATVVWRAEMPAALQNLSWNFDLWLARIIALLLAATARVFRDAAGLWHVGLVLLRIPVRGPFPDVADHVVDAVAVGRKRLDRRGARKAVAVQVLLREIALPGVGAMIAIGRELVAPGIFGAAEPSPRRKFPLRFGRQVLAR